MQNQNNQEVILPVIATTIEGSGSAEAKNDLAHFELTLKAKSESLESAKVQVAEKTAQVLKALDHFKSKGMKLDTEIETSTSNYRLEHREAGEKTPVGFQTITSITWTMVVDGNINELYKTCLKFDAHMGSPWFSIKNRDLLLKQATEKAGEDLNARLNTECKLLNISPGKLKIHTWNFGYDGYLPANNISNYTNNGFSGATGPMGPVGASGPQGPRGAGYEPPVMKIGTTYQELLDSDKKLTPGSITVRVVARANFIWAE